MNSKILLIEDSEPDQKIIQDLLSQHHTVVLAPSLQKARSEIERTQFDLVLLDVDLPDGNGFRYFAQLRSENGTRRLPVIFLTGKADAPDEIMGFSLGAEDYIAKPVDPLRVRARIEARLRTISDRRNSEAMVQKSGLKLDLNTQRASKVNADGEAALDLTPQEFKLLSFFLRHEDHVFSRERLIETVWKAQINIIDRTVDMHVSNLRKKILGSGFTIKSVHGVGYRLTKSEPKAAPAAG